MVLGHYRIGTLPVHECLSTFWFSTGICRVFLIVIVRLLLELPNNRFNNHRNQYAFHVEEIQFKIKQHLISIQDVFQPPHQKLAMH